MAVYTFTVSSVFGGKLGTPETSGEAIDAGDFVYRAADRKVYKALSDTATEADVCGIALCGALGEGQRIQVLKSGDIQVNAAFAKSGQILVLSSTAGKACDYGDWTGYGTLLAYALTANTLRLCIKAYGLEKFEFGF